MRIFTGPLHAKLLALLLAFLALSSVSVLGAAAVAQSDDGAQLSLEEASPVALLRDFFVLEVSMASTYLLNGPEEVLRQAPSVLTHTNRGPPFVLS